VIISSLSYYYCSWVKSTQQAVVILNILFSSRISVQSCSYSDSTLDFKISEKHAAHYANSRQAALLD